MNSAMLKNGLSIVIPVYRSELTLDKTCNEIFDVMGRELAFVDYEVILVNDCSPDNVSRVMQDLRKRSSRIQCFNLLRNYGQHNALLAGIRAARFDKVVTMDDDGQHPPSAIPRLLESLSDATDLVYACPLSEKRGFFRGFSSAAVKRFLNKALGVDGAINISSFRIFRTAIRNAFDGYNSPVVFIDALLAWGTKRVGMIRIEHRVRSAGTSGYSFQKLLSHAIDMVTSFSVLPLRFSVIIGLLTVLAGMGVFGLSLVRFLIKGREVPGFMFLASTIILFSGVQLLSLGVLGEYISRIHVNCMNRPAYIIKEAPSESPDSK